MEGTTQLETLCRHAESGSTSAMAEMSQLLKRHADAYLLDPNDKNSLFSSNTELLKQLLDQYQELFEALYFGYGDMKSFSAKPFEGMGATVMPLSARLDLDEIRSEFNKTLDTNAEYLLKHPDTDWKGDYETGRIWSRVFANEGRKRGFWFNSEKAPKSLYDLMNDDKIVNAVREYTQSPVHCEYLLCEELSPVSLFFHKRDWHMDKLRDQVKVFVPVEDVTEQHGPPCVIENSLPEYLYFNNEPRSHLHFAFVFSAMHTTNNNFIRNDDVLLRTHKTKSALMRKGEMLLLDTRLMHSGSLCSPGHVRKTITLTFRVDSRRNKLMSHLKSFY